MISLGAIYSIKACGQLCSGPLTQITTNAKLGRIVVGPVSYFVFPLVTMIMVETSPSPCTCVTYQEPPPPLCMLTPLININRLTAIDTWRAACYGGRGDMSTKIDEIDVMEDL